jgi:hypothetical protein
MKNIIREAIDLSIKINDTVTIENHLSHAEIVTILNKMKSCGMLDNVEISLTDPDYGRPPNIAINPK